ncbi:MAG: hypothetical protein GYA24_10885 [Candidatus Lokiarchaeota archaeon]|nr:hypothetical protein [Candidatus Lokiarchaeota archaeon]
MVTIRLVYHCIKYQKVLNGTWREKVKEQIPNKGARFCMKCDYETRSLRKIPFICDRCIKDLSTEDQARIKQLAPRFKIFVLLVPILFNACIVLWFFVPRIMGVIEPTGSVLVDAIIDVFLVTLPLQGLLMGVGPLVAVKRAMRRIIWYSAPVLSARPLVPAVCWKCGTPLAETRCPSCFSWKCPSCQTNNEPGMARCMFCDAPEPRSW